MSQKTVSAISMESDVHYAEFEQLIQHRVAFLSKLLFTTSVSEEDLWKGYLNNLPEAHRQHYNCNCCRRFIQRYGGLVTIGDDGTPHSPLWNLPYVPEFFRASVNCMDLLVFRANVTGVFYSSEKVWGNPKTTTWTHLSGSPSNVYESSLKTAEQAMAEKLEDFKILSHGLSEYKKPVVEQAVRVLEADALDRSEKTLGIAKWLLNLHDQLERTHKHKEFKRNLIWKAVASAPPGFCHIRSTMISTLLDDILQGLPFDVISKRWADKMHPLQYQRPTALPKEGNIRQAEELVAKLGVAKSLNRRFATLADVQVKLWLPTIEEATQMEGGVFNHLRKNKGAELQKVELPTITMTWEKFQRTVLPGVLDISVAVPAYGSFYGLVTATDPEAPAIIQWDGLEGYPRNPVSWYFYNHGSSAQQWGLVANTYAPVTAIFLAPHTWQDPGKFQHQGYRIHFAIEGAKDGSLDSLALFPEILRAEFHGIRSVIEAHSGSQKITGVEDGNANGLALQKDGNCNINLRVRTSGGYANYQIDRVD